MNGTYGDAVDDVVDLILFEKTADGGIEAKDDSNGDADDGNSDIVSRIRKRNDASKDN